MGGHGGMDFIELFRMVECLQNGMPLDQNVYEGVFWSSVGPLEREVGQGGRRAAAVPRFHAGQLEDDEAAGHHHVGPAPAQHDGRGVLRPQSPDGLLVPRRAAGGRGDGRARGRRRVRRRLPAAVRAGPRVDRSEPLQRRVLRAPRPAAGGPVGDSSGPRRRHGTQGLRQARLPARPGLPRRPAGRPVHGPRVRPRLPGRPGEDPRDARQHPGTTTAAPGCTDHFNNMRSFALGDERALLMASFPKERPQSRSPTSPR